MSVELMPYRIGVEGVRVIGGLFLMWVVRKKLTGGGFALRHHP